ncbi:MAG TPA: hypothetical protein VHB02_06285 [Acidimicrobiales bacterium]|nr:hypothetical protein [Acidimicrobiales bacterium]
MTATVVSLFDSIRPEPEVPVDIRKLPVEQRFPYWAERHPEVIEHVERLALTAAKRGVRRLSMKSLFEMARAAAVFDTTAPERWRLTNSMAAPLGRLLVERHPELAELFKFRTRRGA